MNSLNQVACDLVYKIMKREDWDAACRTGNYLGSAHDKRDGFIHLSSGPQLAQTAEKYFAGQNDLLLIALRSSDLGDQLKWEPSRGGALFPHLYGLISTSSCLWVRDVELSRDGVPIIPGDIV